MAIILPKGGATFRYDFAVNREKFTGSTGIKARGAPGSKEFEASKAEAQKYEANLKAEKQTEARKVQRATEAKRTLGIVDDKGHTIVPNFLKAVDDYWTARKDTIANQYDDYRSLTWLVDQIGPDTLVTDIRNATVERVVKVRAAMPKLSQPRRDRKTGNMMPGVPQVIDFETQELRPYIQGQDDPRHIVKIAASTANRSSIDVLKRVILYARDTLEVPGMPAIRWKDYRLKEPPARTRTLSLAEEAQIMEHLREGYGSAFLFAVKSSLRLREFAGKFTWDQVNFEGRTITVVQKGDDVHTLPMSDELEAILRQQVGCHPKHVFMFRFKGRGRSPKPWTNPRNGQTYIPGQLYPVTYWGFDSWYDDVKETTGIADLNIHDLRRTAASRIIRETGNLAAARKMTGHKSDAILLRVYNHLSQEEALDDLNKADQRIAERRARELGNKAVHQGDVLDQDQA
jgi:integrase